MLQNIGLKITQIHKFPMAKKKNIFLNGLIDLAQSRLGSKIIYKTDGPNDGLVPMKSSCFEGIQCFLLGNLDHASTVMRTEYFFDIGREKRISYYL